MVVSTIVSIKGPVPDNHDFLVLVWSGSSFFNLAATFGVAATITTTDNSGLRNSWRRYFWLRPRRDLWQQI
jgi:hypothetical protein